MERFSARLDCRSRVKPRPRTSVTEEIIIKALLSMSWISALASFSLRPVRMLITANCFCPVKPVSMFIKVAPQSSL